MFSDHSAIKLEINNRKITGKSPKYLEANTLVSNPRIKEEIKKEIRKVFWTERKWKK